MYNLTGLASNTTSVLSLFQNVNTYVMSGYFGILILVGLWLVIFLSLTYMESSGKKSIIGSFFLLLILTILFYVIDLVPEIFLYIVIILNALILAGMFYNDR